MLMQVALRAVGGGRAAARLSILIFHRVLPQPDDIFPDEMHAARFEQVCAWLKAWFNVLPLDVAVQCMKTGVLPSRACCITFDDGYADNLEIATPILKKHGLSATFFIATGFLGGGRMWNDTVIESIRHCALPALSLPAIGEFTFNTQADRRRAVDAILGKLKYLAPNQRLVAAEEIAVAAQVTPSNALMMTPDQVREMSALGMQIGAHTVNHPILAKIALSEAEQEMRSSRDYLKDLLGAPIGLFAFPNGKPGQDYLPEHADLARELGFDAAVSTAWGVARAGTDPFQLPRFTPWDRSKFGFGLRLLRNF